MKIGNARVYGEECLFKYFDVNRIVDYLIETSKEFTIDKSTTIIQMNTKEYTTDIDDYAFVQPMVIYDAISNTVIVNFLISGYPDNTDKAYLTQALVEFVQRVNKNDNTTTE